jgi:hypothetical protein
MNKIISIALLIGGISLLGGSLSQTTKASSWAGELKLAAAPEIQSTPPPSIEVDGGPKDPVRETNKTFLFQTVNGISLDDSPTTVIEKLGKPLSKNKDPFFGELEIYAYPQMNIGFSDANIDYVEVLVSAGTANIDGINLPIDLVGMKKALGEPSFVAEDGIGFQRKDAFVKIFTDMETKKVTSIHYYHHSNA